MCCLRIAPSPRATVGVHCELLLAPAAMLKTNVRTEDARTLMEVLTPRQFTVTILVASGLKNREIAKTMRVSWHVVRNHLRHIFDRAGCWNRTELALRYVYESEMGLYNKKELEGRLARLKKSPDPGVVKTARKRRA
jgi:DNA-binding CsgD family transcriptional regulator